jgi:hypothetical protein
MKYLEIAWKTIVGIIIIFYLATCSSRIYVTGINDGKAEMQEAAVKNHLGHWECEPNGKSHFVWNTVL